MDESVGLTEPSMDAATSTTPSTVPTNGSSVSEAVISPELTNQPFPFSGLPTAEFTDPPKSKNARKREERYQKKAELLKIKRPLEKARKKQKQLASRQRQKAQSTNEKPYVTKKQERKMLRDKLDTALTSGVKLVVDMSFESIMSPKEIGQLAVQINYMYSTNKKMKQPFCMHLCSLVNGTALQKDVVKRCPGFENYKIKVFEEPVETVFAKEDLIYLSPDSPNTLTEVDPKKVYIIGGLVDGTPKREISLTRAGEIGCQTAKLPIKEHMTRVTPHGSNTILTLNQVYEILMRFHETKSWEEALRHCVPQRKGFKLIGEMEEKIGNGKDSMTSEEPCDSLKPEVNQEMKELIDASAC